MKNGGNVKAVMSGKRVVQGDHQSMEITQVRKLRDEFAYKLAQLTQDFVATMHEADVRVTRVDIHMLDHKDSTGKVDLTLCTGVTVDISL